jgi:hypothetical protein
MFLRDKDRAQSCKDKPVSRSLFLLWRNLRKEKHVSAQFKPISEVVKDFEQSLQNLRPSTKRIYVAGARAAIRAASFEPLAEPIS